MVCSSFSVCPKGVPNNHTKWDPRVLVSHTVNGSLTLGPLKIDHGGRLLEDCVISFAYGAVLDVFPRPSIREAEDEDREEVQPMATAAPASAAPFGTCQRRCNIFFPMHKDNHDIVMKPSHVDICPDLFAELPSKSALFLGFAQNCSSLTNVEHDIANLQTQMLARNSCSRSMIILSGTVSV